MSIKILDLILVSVFFFIKISETTVDLNLAELHYLADHLTPEECRRLVAAAHFKTYDQPRALNEAELKLSKDIPCIELLLHWNSAKEEGKGETHETLEHRLRQMDKHDLADWLGKTVFKALGEDLERSLSDGLKGLSNDTVVSLKQPEPTFIPSENDTIFNWYNFDVICYFFMVILLVTVIIVSVQVIFKKCKKTNRKKRNLESYELLKYEPSDSDSEDKFDVRKLPSKTT